MTKRFTYENHKVKDNLTGEIHSSNMVSVNVLNALHEENQDLKKQMKRLYNYFGDFFSDKIGNNNFSEMWDFVAEDEKWD